MIYIFIIALSALIICTAVTLSYGTNFFITLGFTALAVGLVVAVDGITAAICRALPSACVNEKHKIFSVGKKEKNFYEKIGIRKWKDKVPELGHLTGFRKNRINEPPNLQYVERFLLESRYGEIGHMVSCFTSFLILLFFWLTETWLAISIPVATVSLLLNLPSLFILRYNSYKLEILRKSLLKKQNKKQQQRVA